MKKQQFLRSAKLQTLKLFISFRIFNNKFGKRNECNHVGDYHEVVKEVGKLPNQIVRKGCSEENKYDCNYRVDNCCNFIFFAEILCINFTEEVPADDC